MVTYANRKRRNVEFNIGDMVYVSMRHVLARHPSGFPLPPAAFAQYLGAMFFDPAAEPEAAPPTPIPDFEDISPEEVGEVLTRHYNGLVSSGMCPMPSQLVNHPTGEALGPTSDFLNLCIKAGRPPTTWRNIKLVPLYKEKGDRLDPNNYRALAVGHPLAKLAMGVLNQRLNLLAEEHHLRAPTQAGFRKDHTVEDLGLVLQTSIQQSSTS